ncbi:hypothetical protein ACHAXS_007270, partial [Conticribra weissflogii]
KWHVWITTSWHLGQSTAEERLAKFGYCKVPHNQVYEITTYNQSNSCWLLMTLTLNISTKGMQSIYKMPSKTITKIHQKATRKTWTHLERDAAR